MRTNLSLVAGLALLFFSAFSAFHYVRTTSEPQVLPLDVLGMLTLAVLITLFGAIRSVPEFKSSKGLKTLNELKRDDFLDRPSFRRYNHRARELRKRFHQNLVM